MPSIVVYVPFHSPATTTFQESQMLQRRKNIPSDTFKIRHSHTQSFIKTGIHLSDHTQSSSLFSLAVTMLKPPHSHQITQRLYTIQPCDYPLEKNLLLCTPALHRQAANTLGKFLFCRRGTFRLTLKVFCKGSPLSERIVHSNHIHRHSVYVGLL